MRILSGGFVWIFWLAFVRCEEDSPASASAAEELFRLEGKVTPPDWKPEDWYWKTRILVDGGKSHVGFLKEDNTFSINGLPSGSYLVEVVNPDYFYPPVRVDINSKGKFRARKVNHVQPTQVNQLPYPLKMKPMGRINYFEKREQWKWTDIFMNPMILMMVMPLLLITVLPKMMNDPETKREMEQIQQNMNVQNQVPEISELMANFFGGGGAGGTGDKTKKKPKPLGRRQ